MNPVKHGLIEDAMKYPFCSYKWFLERGDEVMKEQVFSQQIDRVKIFDEF